MEYTFREHKHRYSIWTAARATQRSFTTTSKISSVINKTSLRFFVEANEIINQAEFDNQHKKWCQEIINEFAIIDIPCSYGRAAKIIAIYLKTSFIICSDENSKISKIIHPPIDKILLTSMANKINGLQNCKSISWTKLDKEKYWELVKQIRLYVENFDWHLEKYWTPELDD